MRNFGHWYVVATRRLLQENISNERCEESKETIKWCKETLVRCLHAIMHYFVKSVVSILVFFIKPLTLSLTSSLSALIAHKIAWLFATKQKHLPKKWWRSILFQNACFLSTPSMKHIIWLRWWCNLPSTDHDELIINGHKVKRMAWWISHWQQS